MNLKARIWSAVIAGPFLTCQSIGIAQSTNVPITYGGLSMKNLQVPKGSRITGLEIDLSAAAFESVSHIPVGWKITIDSDSTGHSTLLARANSPSVALDRDELDHVEIEIIKINQNGTLFGVGGSYLMSDPHGEKRVPLDSYNFDFAERYPRRPLR